MSEQTPTEPDETPTEPQPAAEPPRQQGPKQLFRSSRDRIWAGVAGGLGDYFSVDPVIIRIAFAASVFLGGLGAFAYLAMVFFVPLAPNSPGERPSYGDRPRWIAYAVAAVAIVAALSWGVLDHGPFHGPFFVGTPLVILALIAAAIYIARGTGGRRISGPGGALLRLVIAALAFVALGAAALLSAWAGATGHGVIVAAVIVALGLALIATSARGNARWLVVPAVAFAAPLGVVAATDLSFADSAGDREYTPSSLADVPADGYELGVGRLVVDLRDADWRPGTVQPLDLDLGVGELVVAVPHDVCVSADLNAGAGQISLPGGKSDGVDVDDNSNGSATATPRLELSGHVDLGEIRVVNDEQASLKDNGRGRRLGSEADLREACAGGQADAGSQSDQPAAPKSPADPAAPSAPKEPKPR